MSSSLPTPGGSANTWGTQLNDYLQQSLGPDGKLVTAATNPYTSSANTNLASGSQPGLVQLAGDLGNTAASPQVTATHLASPLGSSQGGTGNGFTKFSGPTTAEKTFTLPDSSQTLLYSGGPLGTPSSCTLTNATGLPIAGLTASTSTAIGVGSIELGHASDTTITRSGAGAIQVEGVQVLLSGAALGTPASGTMTNVSGTAASLTAGAVTGLTFASGKTLTVNNILTLAGTDSTTMTFPSTSATIARTDAAQTFTGAQTFAVVVETNNAVTASGNAATVPVTSSVTTVTNNSAATLTITITTSGAVNRQKLVVCVLDASAVAQTISWVNSENSLVSVPTTSNGSTTLPVTVAFMYNNATSKWRCIGVA